MIEYHKLENEILILFKNNNSEDENEVNKMNILVETFKKYWENYQDEWSDYYWRIYETANKDTSSHSNIFKNSNNSIDDEEKNDENRGPKRKIQD